MGSGVWLLIRAAGQSHPSPAMGVARAHKEEARAGFEQPGEVGGRQGEGRPAGVSSHLKGSYREGRARLFAAKA